MFILSTLLGTIGLGASVGGTLGVAFATLTGTSVSTGAAMGTIGGAGVGALAAMEEIGSALEDALV